MYFVILWTMVHSASIASLSQFREWWLLVRPDPATLAVLVIVHGAMCVGAARFERRRVSTRHALFATSLCLLIFALARVAFVLSAAASGAGFFPIGPYMAVSVNLAGLLAYGVLFWGFMRLMHSANDSSERTRHG